MSNYLVSMKRRETSEIMNSRIKFSSRGHGYGIWCLDVGKFNLKCWYVLLPYLLILTYETNDSII